MSKMDINHIESRDLAMLRGLRVRLHNAQRVPTFDELREIAETMRLILDRVETHTKIDPRELEYPHRLSLKVENWRLKKRAGELEEQVKRLLAKEGERIAQRLHAGENE